MTIDALPQARVSDLAFQTGHTPEVFRIIFADPVSISHASPDTSDTVVVAIPQTVLPRQFDTGPMKDKSSILFREVMLNQRKERFSIRILLCEPPGSELFARIEPEYLPSQLFQLIFQTVADFLFEFIGGRGRMPCCCKSPLVAR